MAERFCPFCGQANAVEYGFCQRCGKGLPPAPAPAALAQPMGDGPAPPAAAAPSATPAPQSAAEVEEASVTAFERPLTDEERATLRRSTRRPAVGLSRMFGAFAAMVPIAFVLTGMAGTPYVPANFNVIVIAAAVLSLVLGGASLALRMPAVVALGTGKALELRGVPEKRGAGALGFSPFALGAATIEVGSAVVALLREGRASAIAVVPSGIGKGAFAGKARALVVGVNGAALSRPEAAYLALGSEDAVREFAGSLVAAGKGGKR